MVRVVRRGAGEGVIPLTLEINPETAPPHLFHLTPRPRGFGSLAQAGRHTHTHKHTDTHTHKHTHTHTHIVNNNKNIFMLFNFI